MFQSEAQVKTSETPEVPGKPPGTDLLFICLFVRLSVYLSNYLLFVYIIFYSHIVLSLLTYIYIYICAHVQTSQLHCVFLFGRRSVVCGLALWPAESLPLYVASCA